MSGATASRAVFWRALVWLGVLTLLAVVVALVAPGLGRTLRAWFAFQPGERAEDAGDALAVWAANGRVLALLLLASLATHERRVVPLLDVVVAASVAANVALVGLALGAYGPWLLPWLVHVPLEWAALAVALGVYLAARRCGPSRWLVAQAGVRAALLLALGAAVETWATPLALP